MKTYNARGQNLHLGLFRYLFVVGFGRGAAGASDFTDADTSQTITLMTPADGDILTYPLVQAYSKIGFAGTGLTAVTVGVGFSGGTEFLVGGSLFTVHKGAAAPLVSGSGGPKVFDGSTTLTVTVATTGANLNAITRGEIWIYANLIPISEALKNVDA